MISYYQKLVLGMVAKLSVTLRDIAEKAQVSLSTVSQALRDKGAIAEQTRQRIKAIAADLGYQVSEDPRNLRVAVLCGTPDFSLSEVYDGFYRGIKQELGESVAIVASAQEPGCFPVSTILSEPDTVDGFIFFGGEADHPVVRALQARGVKGVLVNRQAQPNEISTVSVNNQHLFYEITRYLIEVGYTKIAYACVEPMASWSRLRLAGYKSAMEERGLEPKVITSCAEEREVLNEEILCSVPSIEAVVCENDVIGIDVIRRSQAMQVRIPEDLAVFGCDDLEEGRTITPALSTASIFPEQIGRLAGDTLRRLLEGSIHSAAITVPGRLVLRDSVAPIVSQSS